MIGYKLSDVFAPYVSSFSPTDNSVNVSIGSDIVVTFNEAVRSGYGTIVLKTAGGTVIESFSHNSDRFTFSGSTLTINPTADLLPSTAYVVDFMPGSVLDLAGNSYSGTTTYNFATGATFTDDYLATTATSGSLSVGGSATGRIDSITDEDWFAISLTAGQSYSFVFQTPIFQSYSYLSIYLLNSSGRDLTNASGTGSTSISYSAATTGTYYLKASIFNYTGQYTLRVFKSSTLSADTTAPTITSFSPSDEATGVNLWTPITITFNELIKYGTDSIHIVDDAGNNLSTYYSSNVLIDGNTLTLPPPSYKGLNYNTSYHVVIDSGAIQDLAGNSFIGTSTYDFTTVKPMGIVNDAFIASIYDDTINFEPGYGSHYNHTLYTLSGNDVVTVNGSYGTIYLGPGNDQVTSNGGSGYAYGDDGNDTLIGGTVNEHLYGGAGNDIITGGGGSDGLDGGNGTDTLTSGSGNDTLYGGGGSDSLTGGRRQRLADRRLSLVILFKICARFLPHLHDRDIRARCCRYFAWRRRKRYVSRMRRGRYSDRRRRSGSFCIRKCL